MQATTFCRRTANFASLVNDVFTFIPFYTSLKVANLPPLTPEFILQYIYYHRFGNLGQELTYGGSICINANIPIKCVGTCKSHECVEGFRRMYFNSSRCYRHLGVMSYNLACIICVENASKNIHEPCGTCKAMGFVYQNVTSIGNLFKDKTFGEKIYDIIKEMTKEYQRRTCIGLQLLKV